MTLGPSDRTAETQARYQYDIDNKLTVGLQNEPAVVDYKYWKLTVNRYPYDARWSTSMLLVLKRECTWAELTPQEIRELHKLSIFYLTIFDKIERNGVTLSSVPNCPHVHLLQGRK